MVTLKRLSLFILLTLAGLICGCQSNYYSEINGSEMIIGISLPNSSSLNVSAFQSLSGSRIKVKEPANIYHSYYSEMSNSYFGVISINEKMKSETKISPENITTNKVNCL